MVGGADLMKSEVGWFTKWSYYNVLFAEDYCLVIIMAAGERVDGVKNWEARSYRLCVEGTYSLEFDRCCWLFVIDTWEAA